MNDPQTLEVSELITGHPESVRGETTRVALHRLAPGKDMMLDAVVREGKRENRVSDPWVLRKDGTKRTRGTHTGKKRGR